MDLVARLLEYTPAARISPLQACAHRFFDELRDPNTKLPNGSPLPPLFNFSDQGMHLLISSSVRFHLLRYELSQPFSFISELSMDPGLASQLIPDHIRSEQAAPDDHNLPSSSSQQTSPLNAPSSIPSASATPASSDTTDAANFKASSGNANSSTANAVVASSTGMN